MANKIDFDLTKFPVDKDTGCILWPYTRSIKSGYARKRQNGKVRQVSRILLEIKLGRAIAKGKCALHSCDNPPCINPDHLQEGTHSQNMQQMWSRNRHPKPKKLFTKCAVPGCTRPFWAKHLCNTHYSNMRYHQKITGGM